MIKQIKTIVAVIMVVLFYSCEQQEQQNEIISGIDLAYMDTTADPGNDFFRYVNGLWLDQTTIPDDRSIWGSFHELIKETDKRTLEVLKQAIESNKYGPETDQAKVALFYETAMDTVYLNKLGLEPAMEDFKAIESISSIEELQQFVIDQSPYFNNYLYGFTVSVDRNNSDRHIGYMSTGAIGLPERDYYLSEDEETLEIQKKYKKHMTRMLTFFDVERPEQVAAEVFQLEKQLAAAKMSKEDKRDPEKRNNPRSIEELKMLTGAVDWDYFFKGIGISPDTVIVSELNYYN